MAEERMRDDTCPTCGGPVVVQGDGLTHWYRPAPTDQGERDGLAERLEARARHAQWDGESRLRSKAEAGIRAAAFREAAAMARDESSTEGGARPGDTPLNDTRTNSDRPWREDVARAFVTNRPAPSEGAGEARVREAERLLRRAYADTHPEEVPLDVLRWLHPNDPAPAPDTPTEGEGT